MTSRRFGPYTVDVTNDDKILFPDSGITKGEVIDYYVAIADTLLTHVRERPLVLERFPDGITEEGFYHKQVPEYFPDWIETVTVAKAGGQRQTLAVANNAASLAYLANQGTITLHAWLSRRDRIDVPDLLVLDLDPAEGQGFAAVREAAKWTRDLFVEVDAPAFVKTTGSSGVHIAVPLDRGEDFAEARGVARALARLLAERHPEDLTVEQRKDKRGGRLFVDAGRNAYAQTWAAPYAVRPLRDAPVSLPVEWEELMDGDVGPRTHTLRTVPDRLRERGDVWADMSRHAVTLRRVRDGLAALRDD